MSDQPRSLAEVYERLQALETGGTAPAATAAADVTPKAATAPQPGKAKRRARTIARLAAVQALYQMEMAGAGVETVIREFADHRFEADPEGEGAPGDHLADADEDFFADIARGVVARQDEIDAAIRARLAQNWKLERLDATARAILRAGAFELMARPDIPLEVAIDEYVEIAKAFFEGPEPGFINAALDGVARDARA